MYKNKNYISFQYFLFKKNMKFRYVYKYLCLKYLNFINKSFFILYYSIYKNNLYIHIFNNTYINIVLQYILKIFFSSFSLTPI